MAGGYQSALEAAGCSVHLFESFGSYQGEWVALVTTKEGEKGWVFGSYGSCSGCDAFDAEFDYAAEQCETHKYESYAASIGCPDCQEKAEQYQGRLAAFGEGYLPPISQEAAEAHAKAEASWSSEDEKMYDFVVANRITKQITWIVDEEGLA